MHSANGLAEDDLYLLQAVLKGKLTAEAALAGAAAAQSPLRIANALLELETTVKEKQRPGTARLHFCLAAIEKSAQRVEPFQRFCGHSSFCPPQQHTAPTKITAANHSAAALYAKSTSQ
ncbi:hypothetical protein [Pseudomonas sp. FP198]|uniref:hypothetical protein n=1 Tax=Pseudomonas sp. FP198 TaxID=2954084 RepID=UPI0027336146|nr:hypothetical protein [Pseudomonas sp. FP198]WLG95160.1 hypothetical protein PSH78_22850 [Pseudomonas sp. FP198]